tara:strand:- start:89 stop:661 length:573 start_codon:yes stop_codon:yes gene_type:complete
MFSGCALPKKRLFVKNKTYLEYTEEYKSCTGRGVLDSKGELKGKLLFSFKSQRDSTFLEFADILGRKSLLIWITPSSITARNLMENKQYNQEDIINIFPLLTILKPSDMTKMFWGVEPEYKKNLKDLPRTITKNIELSFDKKRSNYNGKTIGGVEFYNRQTMESVLIDFKSRKMNVEDINMKKFWRLLNY